MHENAHINILYEGFIIKASIEGKLKIIHPIKQKNTRICLGNKVYHFINTSDIHQKFGTFN
jgi:hypothetical protein